MLYNRQIPLIVHAHRPENPEQADMAGRAILGDDRAAEITEGILLADQNLRFFFCLLKNFIDNFIHAVDDGGNIIDQAGSGKLGLMEKIGQSGVV